MAINYLKPKEKDTKYIKKKPTVNVTVRMPEHIHKRIISFQNSNLTEYTTLTAMMIQLTIKYINDMEKKNKFLNICKKIISLIVRNKKQEGSKLLDKLVKIVDES